MRWWLLALPLLLVASSAPAQRIGLGVGVTLGGGGAGATAVAPALTNLAGTVAEDAATGSAIVTPVATGLSGCTFAIGSQSYFAQATGGAVTTKVSSIPAGGYAPVTTCSLTTGGQTVSVSAALAITVSAAVLTGGQLNFSDPAQSGLFTLL